MLIRNITTKRDIPHEPGEWMVLRKLTGRQLRVAADKVGENALDKMRKMGGEVFKAVNDINASSAATAAKDEKTSKVVDPLNSFDMEVLLGYGIASWSYVDSETSKGVPCNDETKAQLDQTTERWAALEILKFSGVLRTEEEQKNG